MDSMARVKFLPDGMIDPDTVDGRVRSLCMCIVMESERQEWKEAISLREIQERYFERVEYMFGELFKIMTQANSNPYSFSRWFSSDENNVMRNLTVIDEFYKEIMEFWGNISEPTWIHLEDLASSKAVFTGELFPNARSNIASSTGLYFDTTILPDPFMKVFATLQFMDDKEKCYETVRLALQVLSYKSLALADIEQPIIAVLPDRHRLEDGYREFVHKCAEADSIRHTKTLFGKDIADKEELFDFYSRFKDADTIVKELINPDKLVFATEWDGSLAQQMIKFLNEQGGKLGIENVGQAVYMNLYSRFSQANDAFQRSSQLHGTPIICAETSWIWYNHMLEHHARNTEQGKMHDLHIARALNAASQNEMPWLGNIPPDALIEIRKSGAFDEIRELLSGGIKNLIEANNSSDFNSTGNVILKNLDTAFKDHEKKLNELISKKWKFAGKDIGSFVIVGGIEIAAAITGQPIYGTAGVLAAMTGIIPTAKDLKNKFQELKTEEKNIKNTGIGILFKHKT